MQFDTHALNHATCRGHVTTSVRQNEVNGHWGWYDSTQYTSCVMESRPDGRAVSVCEPSARSCEHQHVPLGVPPIPWLVPWLEPTRPKGGGGGKKTKHSSENCMVPFKKHMESLRDSESFKKAKEMRTMCMTITTTHAYPIE